MEERLGLHAALNPRTSPRRAAARVPPRMGKLRADYVVATLLPSERDPLRGSAPRKTLPSVHIPIVVPRECPMKYSFCCPVLFTMKSIIPGRSYLAISSKLQNKTGAWTPWRPRSELRTWSLYFLPAGFRGRHRCAPRYSPSYVQAGRRQDWFPGTCVASRPVPPPPSLLPLPVPICLARLSCNPPRATSRSSGCFALSHRDPLQPRNSWQISECPELQFACL